MRTLSNNDRKKMMLATTTGARGLAVSFVLLEENIYLQPDSASFQTVTPAGGSNRSVRSLVVSLDQGNNFRWSAQLYNNDGGGAETFEVWASIATNKKGEVFVLSRSDMLGFVGQVFGINNADGTTFQTFAQGTDPATEFLNRNYYEKVAVSFDKDGQAQWAKHFGYDGTPGNVNSGVAFGSAAYFVPASDVWCSPCYLGGTALGADADWIFGPGEADEWTFSNSPQGTGVSVAPYFARVGGLIDDGKGYYADNLSQGQALFYMIGFVRADRLGNAVHPYLVSTSTTNPANIELFSPDGTSLYDVQYNPSTERRLYAAFVRVTSAGAFDWFRAVYGPIGADGQGVSTAALDNGSTLCPSLFLSLASDVTAETSSGTTTVPVDASIRSRDVIPFVLYDEDGDVVWTTTVGKTSGSPTVRVSSVCASTDQSAFYFLISAVATSDTVRLNAGTANEFDVTGSEEYVCKVDAATGEILFATGFDASATGCQATAITYAHGKLYAHCRSSNSGFGLTAGSAVTVPARDPATPAHSTRPAYFTLAELNQDTGEAVAAKLIGYMPNDGPGSGTVVTVVEALPWG